MLVKRHCCKKKRALSSDRKSPAALMVARDHLSASIWTARHHAGRDLPRSEDRPRHVTNSFDFLFDALEADDPARTGFKPFITPGESGDHRTLVQHQLDVAANVFRMDKPLLESLRVEREIILHDLPARALVRVGVLTEKFVAAHSDFRLELLGKIRPHPPDRRIHGVIT